MKKLFTVVALLAVVAAFAVGCKKEEGVTKPDAIKPTEAPAVPATNAPATH